MDLTQFSYYDRRTGELKRDPIYAGGLVDWLYNSAQPQVSVTFLRLVEQTMLKSPQNKVLRPPPKNQSRRPFYTRQSVPKLQRFHHS